VVEQEIYLGEISFDGKQGPVYSVATEAQDILIGTKLLRGKTLVVNFRTKQVTVR
jgi:predicted aspartyl protease